MKLTLAERLAPLIAQYESLAGPHFRRITAFIEDHGLLERRKQPGEVAPDFALPDPSGAPVRLSALLAHRSVVLVFIRGMWCPFCEEQVSALVEMAPDFEAAGVTLLLISPEVSGRTEALAAKHRVPFPVLCDLDSGVALTYGCLFPVPPRDQDFLRSIDRDLTKLYGNGAWFMPIASAFAVTQEGRIAATFGYADARRRPEPEALIAAAVGAKD